MIKSLKKNFKQHKTGDEQRTILKIKVKEKTTIWNMMGIIVAPMVSVFAGSYVNAMMPYLL